MQPGIELLALRAGNMVPNSDARLSDLRKLVWALQTLTEAPDRAENADMSLLLWEGDD